MKVLDYKVILPNENCVVPELDRTGYMTPQYIDMMRDVLDRIELKGKCAFLYAGGALLTSSEARNTNDNGRHRENVNWSCIAIKELAAYSMHKWIGELHRNENIRYANINGNTCASSMHSLYEAERLLNDGFDQVVIVAEEKTSYNTLRIFDEHKIDLKVGEGCALVHLGKADSAGSEDITNCKWFYEYTRNPFGVSQYGYNQVYSEHDIVKPHGTGTVNNELAEQVFYGKPQLRYKETIGHTQGASGLIEVCMVLDSDVQGDVLCVSSGLGGYYGSCIVHKR